jgi:hypothetical protein
MVEMRLVKAVIVVVGCFCLLAPSVGSARTAMPMGSGSHPSSGISFVGDMGKILGMPFGGSGVLGAPDMGGDGGMGSYLSNPWTLGGAAIATVGGLIISNNNDSSSSGGGVLASELPDLPGCIPPFCNPPGRDPIPEPVSSVLFAAGAVVVGLASRKRWTK